MTNITLQVDRDEDLRLLLELIRRLNLAVVKVNPVQTKTSADERRHMIDYILKYQNDKPSFGDAAEWQSRERDERELPWLFTLL
jgi:hypothetical protein